MLLALACSPEGAAAQVSSGTAFSVAPEFLVTNQHVVAECRSIEVIAPDGRRNGAVVDADDQIDLALVRVSGLKGATARLRTPSNIRLGELVMVFGFPLAGSLSSSGNFTSGLISAVRGLRDAAGELQITAPVQPGNSGGPLMDASGLVIGVVQSKLDALRSAIATGDIPQNINFAISLAVLTDFLVKNRVAFRTGAVSPTLDTARVAELAQSFTYRIECQRRPLRAISPNLKRQSPPAQTSRDSTEMVPVPAGEFWMGSEDSDAPSREKPRRRVYLDAFRIDKYEVSNALYREFMVATGRTAPHYWNDSKWTESNQPVVGVDWNDATTYCTWAGKRLPTEAEWEKSAGGTEGSKYSWGEQWDASRANSRESKIGKTVAVGSYSSGASPFGPQNMAQRAKFRGVPDYSRWFLDNRSMALAYIEP